MTSPAYTTRRHLIAACLATAFVTALRAQDAGTATTEDRSKFTSVGYVRTQTDHAQYVDLLPYWSGCYYWGGNYYYWGGCCYNPAFSRFEIPPDYDKRLANSRKLFTPPDRQSPKSIWFFPQNPPPIGTPIPPEGPVAAQTPAPSDLASYPYEPFYAPLGTRLRDFDLSKDLAARIENYRTVRASLRTGLQQRLTALHDAPVEDRANQLASFADQQAPMLAALEAEAEQLRADLAGTRFHRNDWSAPPHDASSRQTAVHEFLLIRAATFYLDGLSPAQRRLLRELSMELQSEAFKPTEMDEPAADSSFLFFSPETARIRIPENLPTDLAAKIGGYRNEKTRLKKELRATLFNRDNAPLASEHAHAIRRLAEAQTPAIAKLELLADEIRAGLASLSDAPEASATTTVFPPELAGRILAYKKEKLAIQKLFQLRLEAVRQRFAPDAYRLSSNATSNNQPSPYQLAGGDAVSEENVQQIRNAVAELNRQNAGRLLALGKEREALRGEVARIAAARQLPGGDETLRSLLRIFFDSFHDEEIWQRYEDYRTAVYQPGLSPEQRRLLFGIALEKLAFPLPDGEPSDIP